ncbi:MAG TPA: SulP family inorganic anion transporter [Stellaceae bacterium]|nr:SulP family inorganic anion transporter [Stellaceae bacterium]
MARARAQAMPMRGLGLAGREMWAGIAVIATAVPSCLAAGVLAFGPLGPGYVAAGVAAGLCSAIFAGPIAAVVAGAPWLVPTPRASTAVIQASLLATLWRTPAFADPALCLAALALCILAAGGLQMLFGLAGVARLVRFTPHPVLAGFLNGVALLLCLPQLGRYIELGPSPGIPHPFMLLFVLALAGLTIYARRFSEKVPGPLISIVIGVAAFYALGLAFPALELGPTMGSPGMVFLPAFPLATLPLAALAPRIVPLLPAILLTALTIAIVASFDSLLTLRIAQKQAQRPVLPMRDLVAQGVGNCVAALSGALATQLSPNVVLNAYRAGGRTVLTPLFAALLLLAVTLTMSRALAGIPMVVLSATVLANGVTTFDRWSLRMLFDTAINRGHVARRHAWHDLLVVLVVMGITASGAIIAGVLSGAALACIIFIANMSRPIFRRVYRGNELSSKRVRPASDAELLLATGRRRAVLELQGVLFFGNADDLADRINQFFAETDMLTLDVRGITDIDISGAQVLLEIVGNARRRGKWILFCNVPPDLARTIGELKGDERSYGPLVLPDQDSAVEWMEEEALRRDAAGRGRIEALALGQLDFTQGLDADELALLQARVAVRVFAPGETICAEGDAADRLWLLARGSVSVRLAVPDGGSRRIASLAMGTVVGEMALLGSGRRSASVVADDEVHCYELAEPAFRALLDEHPRLAGKILANLAREMARRVRVTSEYLRYALG